MSIVHIGTGAEGHDYSGNNGTYIDSEEVNHLSGNLLTVAVVAYDPGGTVTITVTDAAGNTYHSRTIVRNGDVCQLFYAYNSIGDASNFVTAHFSISVPYRTVLVEQWSGFGTSDPYDTEASGFDALPNTVATSGEFTTTQADELIVAVAVMPNPGGSMIPDTGFTLRQQPATSSVGIEDRIVSSILTDEMVTMESPTTVNRWSIALATFKGSSEEGGDTGGHLTGGALGGNLHGVIAT